MEPRAGGYHGRGAAAADRARRKRPALPQPDPAKRATDPTERIRAGKQTQHERTEAPLLHTRGERKRAYPMKTIVKAFCALILIAVLGIFAAAILPALDIDNPLSDALDSAKNAAANAAIDASGVKGKLQQALEDNRDVIAHATGMTSAQVDQAIANLDIESWQATSLPDGATATGTSSVSYGGVDAALTTYDDPSVITVDAYGQSVTLSVPSSAQPYLGYLSYL